MIIIGAGISGLYAALQYDNVIVLESGEIGGRTNTDSFYGTDVVTGAGIGRKHKDHLLIALLNDMGIPIKEFPIKIAYSPKIEPVDVVNVNQYLKRESTHETFEKYATRKLGKKLYKQFVLSSGYSDYEKEDAYDTTHYYGMEDNKDGWIGFSVPWRELIHNMAKKIRKKGKIITHSPVKRIEKIEDGFRVFSNRIYETKKIILATSVDTVRYLLQLPYQQIQGQPFIRIYAKFDKKSSMLMKEIVKIHTIVCPPLQKIIPMNAEKGVYMIAYADNESALYLKSYSKNTASSRHKLETLIRSEFGIDVTIIAIKSYFWDIGTHYYTPLKNKTRQQFIYDAQHPIDGIAVVGEMVALNQGWVEGALESVHNLNI